MKETLIFITILAAYTCANDAKASTRCDWNNPGSNRYTGNQAEALNNYKDIPAPIREELKKKINAHKYDDHITISRIGMVGKYEYDRGRDMHWGENKMCIGEFNISKWSSTHTEAALVYTYNGYSVAIPSVCGNVFRLNLIGGGNQRITTVVTPSPEAPEAPQEETFVPDGGGYTPQPSTVPTVDWPSEKPQQNGLIPDRAREFMPVPPMPVTPTFVFVKPQDPITTIPVVPEPSTYAMMLLGLCLLVGLSQRNKK
jgi:hypothetical protein